jgi:hypothetical protein
MYLAYFQAMKWLALMQARESVEAIGKGNRLSVWRQNHRDMVNRLHDLEQDPEHQGTLAIHSQWIDEPEFRSFLTEAEYSEDWLTLMRPRSQSNSPENHESATAPSTTQ